MWKVTQIICTQRAEMCTVPYESAVKYNVCGKVMYLLSFFKMIYASVLWKWKGYCISVYTCHLIQHCTLYRVVVCTVCKNGLLVI